MDATDTTDRQTERIEARGHEHVAATHESTFEVTTDDWLTPAGDCIVGIEADRTPADFTDAFVERVREGAAVTIELLVGEPDGTVDELTRATATHVENVRARGDERLTFDGDRSLVVRTSDYVDDRTVAVGADRAAADLSRDAVETLAAGAPLVCLLHAESPA